MFSSLDAILRLVLIFYVLNRKFSLKLTFTLGMNVNYRVNKVPIKRILYIFYAFPPFLSIKKGN